MEIAQTGQSLTQTGQTQGTNAGTMIASDFETFLKMLTAQMENQDPLNPIESSDYAVQLATFSGVEQQVRTNALLETLGLQMGLMGMAQFAGWVGMEARAAAPAHFSGSPITLSPNPRSTADEATMVVRDAQGAEISRFSVAVSTDPIEWAGVDAQGNPLPNGTYSFELESYANGQQLSVDPVEVYARVTEAGNEGGETVLVLAGGVRVPASSVSALRQPG